MIRLLIADDDDNTREIMRTVIPWQQHGIEVIADVSNGRDALHLIETQYPDIALLDILMPLMDGIHVAQYVSEHRLPVRIIFLSGYDEFQYAREGLRYGVSDYLLKPCPPGEIFHSIEKCLARGTTSQSDRPEKQAASSNALVNKAIAFMELHYAEPLDLNRVASEVYITPAYLSTIFKQNTGTAFSDYLNNLRIMHACELLQQLHLKTYQIAERVGFNDVKYFNRLFKKHCGLTPREFRNQFQREAADDDSAQTARS